MNTRIIDLAQDYQTISEWFEFHGSHKVPEKILPKLGVVCEEGDSLLAAGWMYMDNSVSIAWPTWFVTNPSVSQLKTGKALAHVINALELSAKEIGYTALMTSVNNAGLERFLINRGYIKNHSGMSQLFKVI